MIFPAMPACRPLPKFKVHLIVYFPSDGICVALFSVSFILSQHFTSTTKFTEWTSHSVCRANHNKGVKLWFEEWRHNSFFRCTSFCNPFWVILSGQQMSNFPNIERVMITIRIGPSKRESFLFTRGFITRLKELIISTWTAHFKVKTIILFLNIGLALFPSLYIKKQPSPHQKVKDVKFFNSWCNDLLWLTLKPHWQFEIMLNRVVLYVQFLYFFVNGAIEF